MKAIIKLRWVLLAVWIVGAVVLSLLAPNMENLVREKGQIGVPSGYSSSLANEILDKKSGENENEASIVVVYHDKKKLDQQELEQIKHNIEQFKDQKKQLGITEVTTHFEQADLKNQLVSKDNKTILALLTVDMTGKEIGDIRKSLQKVVDKSAVEAHMTGSNLIDEDVVVSSQEGLKKTEIITLVFILAVLIIVFRSVVAPIIPLITVGFTYIISQSIVAYLVDYFDFPLSNFTQIFLVAILFGIGTDYCILLLSRFKEEMVNYEDPLDAIAATYKTAGRTVLFSGLAVLVGFASIGLATFKLYQSASAVAIGVAVLLLALWTVVPFFMVVLGKKLFWPMKGAIGHSQSRLWGWAGNLSIKRPFIVLLILAAVIAPLLWKYDGKLSFNSLDEIGDSYESVKGFNLISDSFGPGESLPAKIVIENDERMDNREYLTIIEKINRELDKVKVVDKVRSATRPVGDDLEDLYVSNQVDELNKGLGQGNDGIVKIRDGLKEASTNLTNSTPQMKEATGNITKLVEGTNGIKTGVTQVQSGLTTIEEGLRKGTLGAGEAKKGLQEVKKNAVKLANANSELLKGYQTLQGGLGELSGGYGEIQKNLSSISEGLAAINTQMGLLPQKYPDVQSNANFMRDYGALQQQVGKLSGGATELNKGLQTLNTNLQGASKGLATANTNLSKVVQGQQAFGAGIDQLITGITQLETGIGKAADGQSQIISKLPEMSTGLGKLAEGQKQLQTGVGTFVSKIGELTNGLDQSVTGLTKVSGGLDSATSYLAELAKSQDKDMTGWYLPKDALKNKEFQQILDVYMSTDRKVTTIDVVLKVNPYSNKALTNIQEVEDAVKRGMNDTKLENATFGISGVSSIFADLKQISDADYSKTVTFMLIGIALILIILLRSLIMPAYIIASLLLTYYTSAAMTEVIFVDILGYPGVNWAVPFFGFVLLMALGVDYSIFLMDRFNEYRKHKVEEAIILSMKNMGTVILSAAIILAGTFAAMLPSGVLSLLQIATLVLTGLLLYALLLLPFFVPSMVKIFGKANWWPFLQHKEEK
ncbi:MMPL family transporter [Priestia koreensis]|uniref:SSD domain-containing protein n=2 Tax=Bacteria TaxID=2 RepID=A0A0M0LHK9_9BACI|nr:MMPL family transporter [Priestia koreensis]KOO50560.1 hypothetical protein AMD01_02080 [Priestia koreensis]